MALYSPKRGISRPSQPVAMSASIPASVGGINGLDNLMGMAPTDALQMYNIMPDEQGMRVRKGYREWATGVPNEVRSMIPYDDQSGTTARDRLFACCEDGIYNVTSFNETSPTQVQAFSSNGTLAGYGVSCHFVTDAGDKVVFYADGENGLYMYNGTTQTWTAPGASTITFPAGDPTTAADIAFVMVHKQRIWIVPSDEAHAYYLPVDAVGGAATKFNFGSKFPHGGNLNSLWTWTVDGGDGVDDFLVAISQSGDVLPYYGPDPSDASWSLRGSYYVGNLPNSRRVGVKHGAELFLLSWYGLISVRDLLQGVDFEQTKIGVSAKVTRSIRARLTESASDPCWQLQVHPSEGIMQVLCPTVTTTRYQYTQNTLTKGWAWWTIDALCAMNWKNDYYFGGPDGQVWLYDGSLDNTQLSGGLGNPIEFGGLTSYQPFGEHGRNCQIGHVRAIGVSRGTIALNTEVLYDYDITSAITRPSSGGGPVPGGAGTGVGVWDSSLWDIAVWDFELESGADMRGSGGLGRTAAIAWRGQTESRITIIGWDVTVTQGGLL